jgi:hypothetical protein
LPTEPDALLGPALLSIAWRNTVGYSSQYQTAWQALH